MNRENTSAISVGINKKVYDELTELGAPKEIIETVFTTYETPALKNQIFFAAQYLLKNDGFNGGYTKDLYKLMKKNNQI